LNVALSDQDVHPKERKKNAIGQGLVDVGRALDPENAELFTWWAP
jgi:exonuclease III